MNHLPISILFAILVLSSCKNRSEEQRSIPVILEDSSEKLDTVFSQKDITSLNQLKLSQYASAQNSPIDWSTFSMVTSFEEDSLLRTAFKPDKLFYEQYGQLLKYSPDSTMFIDLDSYNIEVQQNKMGQSIIMEKGPDTEVSLVQLESKERTRLAFLGPGNGVEEALWVDNNNVLLIGYNEIDTTKLKKAFIWRYHIPTKLFHVYESSDSRVGGQLTNWRKQRFNQLLGE